MVGYAQSNARVSTLMRNLGASPYLENPELVEIKAVPTPGNPSNRVNEFSMNISIKRAQSDEAAPARARVQDGGGEMNLIEELRTLDPKQPGNWPWPVKVGAFLADLHR